jgi:hypothetical protein
MIAGWQRLSFYSPDSLQFQDEDLEQSVNGCRFKVVVSMTEKRDKAIRDRMRQDVRKIMIEHDPLARWALLYGKRQDVV